MNVTVTEAQVTNAGLVTRTTTQTVAIQSFANDPHGPFYASFYISDNNVLAGTTDVIISFNSNTVIVPFLTTTTTVNGVYFNSSPFCGYYWESLT
jgi:hypothetical protein